MPHLEAVLDKCLARPDDQGCLTRCSPALKGQQHGAGAAKSLNRSGRTISCTGRKYMPHAQAVSRVPWELWLSQESIHRS